MGCMCENLTVGDFGACPAAGVSSNGLAFNTDFSWMKPLTQICLQTLLEDHLGLLSCYYFNMMLCVLGLVLSQSE